MSDEYLSEILAYAKKLNWDYKPASWKDIAKQLEQENQRLKSIVNEVGHYFKKQNNKHYDGDKMIAIEQNKDKRRSKLTDS